MMEINPYLTELADLSERASALRIALDYDSKKERLEEVERELESSDIWQDPTRAQSLGKERVVLTEVLKSLDMLHTGIDDLNDLFVLARDENDEQSLPGLMKDLKQLAHTLAQLEFERRFCHPMDINNAFIDIQSGSGGTEAQDWAEMLLRMYLRWGEQRGFAPELLEVSPGDVAGIRSATFKYTAAYAYGWARTETGVHRLVRKSPFDSGNRRHTSFASVFVYPEIDDSVEIDINPADLRIDTYRASGAGGQHVNRTDSAIRITHIPSGIVVQCQSDRSQHKNRAQAMKQLRAKLYEIELRKRDAERQALEETKTDIGWGSQIRSYVLDQSRVKDLRTGIETSNTQAVLDGGLDLFVEASLREGY